jgi:glycosyltransferase involved in cell wall biosynthesis
VVALGDPRSPRTWSGCPVALVAALERQGWDVIGIDAGLRGWHCLPWAVRYHVRRWWHSPLRAKLDLRLQRTLVSEGYRSDFHWDLRLRERRARRALAAVRRSGATTVLHCTPNALSREAATGIRQLAYLDATWTSQTRHRRPGGGGRYPARLVEEGDAHDRASHAYLEHVFTMGQWLVDELTAVGVPLARISNVGTGIVNGDRAHHERSVPGRMLTVVKDLVDERGVPTAVAALEVARRTDPSLHLVVVGNAAAARRFGDVPGVEAPGYVARSVLDRLLDEASLLVLPASYQAWGMVFLEAMDAGVPVLALDRFAAPEITEDGSLGFLVDEQDPEQVATAMLDAFSDQHRLAKLGRAGQRSVRRRFSWDGVAAKMAAVITQVDEPQP